MFAPTYLLVSTYATKTLTFALIQQWKLKMSDARLKKKN